MKKTILFIAACCAVMSSYAAKATKDYLRPSLSMVLMTSSEDAVKNASSIAITDPTLLGYCAEAWKNYQFPALYNDFRTATTSTQVGAAKGSIMEILAKYQNADDFANMSIADLKNIIESMKGKQYLENLKAEVDKNTDKIAHELVARWWGIKSDGSYTDDTLRHYACYSATQAQVADAAQTTEGAAQKILNEMGQAVMANTYVTFTKVDFYENEPIAKFTYNIMMAIAAQTPAPADAAAKLAAEKTYDKMKDGYTAFANALLYKLQWDSATVADFYSCWNGEKIDMKKFNAMKFHLIFVGNDKTSVTCMMKKGDQGKEASHMVYKTIHKSLDKQFVALQDKNEEFRPMVPIVGIGADGLPIADMGTKEGVQAGDKFNLLKPVFGGSVPKYQTIATLKVMKDGVWDNQDIDNADAANASDEIKGTKLSKNKLAEEGMLVKKAK